MKENTFFLPDFIEIQRKSYFSFLNHGILDEFSKHNPITSSDKNIEVFFYPDHYKLTKPKYNVKQAIFFQKSYVSKLYLPAQIIDRKRKKVFLKWVFIAHLPLMTNRGHFLLNGSARILMNQLIRSPGIYFRESCYEIYSNTWAEKPDLLLKRFYADIICSKGTWLRLELDKDFCLWARIKKGPKIPLLWLLLGFGIAEQTIFNNIQAPYLLLRSFEKEFEESLKKRSVTSISSISEIFSSSQLNLNEAGKSNSELLPRSLSRNRSEARTSARGLRRPVRAARQELKYSYVSNPVEAWIELAKLLNLKKGKMNPLDLGRLWLFKKFMNPKMYDLSRTGRLALNKKLGLTLSLSQSTLTPQDVLAATNRLIEVAQGSFRLDDIDHLKNRRVRTAGDLLQTQFGLGLLRLEKNIRVKFDRLPEFRSYSEPSRAGFANEIQSLSQTTSRPTKSASFATAQAQASQTVTYTLNKDPNLLIFRQIYSNLFGNGRSVNGVLREFFGTNPLSQFMDQINPLAELTHKRRLTSLGPGGVARDTATLAVRGIHPSHYGRICPIETPEGKNTGLVNSITTYARVNSVGLIETPFYKIYKGQIQRERGIIFLTADQEENLKLATPDLRISKLNFLPKFSVPTRAEERFVKASRLETNYIGISPLQMISVATSFIPFLEHDDANRALMGSNMQRQAVPVLRPERPVIGTGLEARAVSDSGHALTSQIAGYVFYVSGSQIILYHSR
uniref:DNA-directed RNA polymerase n=1 Tax=Raphidocelis subcapitata TaxID=307507 RepID=A0A2Z6FBL5_9CHLO|nr:DNA-directed RNA polymerase subunit beta fragment a [Raphidocelis subcapitata]